MVAIAAMFRIPGPAYRAPFGDRMLPRHRRAMQDIERCRTAPLGGQVSHGATCQAYPSSSHSCTNRHGPQCQQDQAQQGLAHQQRLRLPVPPVMVTFTRPAALRGLARRHQKTLYTLRFRSAAEAVQELALAPRFIGGRIGMVGVLQTWTRDRRYHPHVHDLVAGGGLSAEGPWLPARHDVLVHVTPRSGLCRAQCRDDRPKTDLFPLVEAHVWHKDWVVHGEPVGRGEEAFRSLAPSSFRVAISNHRVLQLEEGHVTLHSKESATDQTRSATVPAQEVIRRFLPHVLPERCINVRDDGFLSPGNRHVLTTVRTFLGPHTVAPPTTGPPLDVTAVTKARDAPRCPQGGNILRRVETLRPNTRSPP